jgi:hypothetical protein
MAQPPWMNLGDFVLAEHAKLDFVRLRFSHLVTFATELGRLERGKPFDIANSATWTAMIDSRDMLVIHLASWVTGTVERGGFFGQLCAHAITDFRRAKPWSGVDAYDKRQQKIAFANAWERTFPGVARSRFCSDDVVAFQDRFHGALSDIVQDRNEHRAHVFERKQATSEMLDLYKLGSRMKFIERTFGDLFLIVTAKSLAAAPEFTNVSSVSVGELVDQVIFGSCANMQRARGTRSRDELFDELHRLHDASDGTKAFNAPAFVAQASKRAST